MSQKSFSFLNASICGLLKALQLRFSPPFFLDFQLFVRKISPKPLASRFLRDSFASQTTTSLLKFRQIAGFENKNHFLFPPRGDVLAIITCRVKRCQVLDMIEILRSFFRQEVGSIGEFLNVQVPQAGLSIFC